MFRCYKLILFTLLTLIALACLSPQAKAGLYEVHMCDGVNPGVAPMSETWWSGPWRAQENRGSCNYSSGGGTWNLSWGSKNDIPELSFGREGGYGATLNAPSGTSFDYVRLSSNLFTQGGGHRCAGAFRGDGSFVQGTANCLGPSFQQQVTGEQTREGGDVNSGSVSILAFCVRGYGACNGGDANHFWAQIWGIVIRINDSTNPTLSGGSGLWSKEGWVRGTWPVGFNAEDGMGIKTSRAVFGGKTLAEAGHCNVAQASSGIFYGGTTVPCVGSIRADYNINTTTVADGQAQLSLQASDATSNTASADKTVSVDNSAPLVTNLSGVGPTTDNTPTIGITANDPQSGISGYLCKVDNGSYASCSKDFTTQTLALGEHNVCVKALNNASDSSGNPNQSAEFCRSVTVGAAQQPGQGTPPSNPGTTPSKPGSGTTPSKPGDGSGNVGTGLTVKFSRLIVTNGSVTLQTKVTTDRGGALTQNAVNYYGKRKLRCNVTREVASAGSSIISCSMGKTTRKALRKRGMTVLLSTSLYGDDNQVARRTNVIAIRKRG